MRKKKKRSTMFNERTRGNKGMIYVQWHDPDGKRRSRAVSPDPDVVREFKIKLANRLQRHNAGLPVRDCSIDEFVNQYMVERSYADKRPNSTKRDILTIKRFRETLPQITTVEQFTASALNTYKALRRQAGKKESTINRELGTLKNMLKFAYKKKYRDTNDSEDVKFFEVSRCVRDEVLSAEEIKKLLEFVQEPYRCAIMLGYWAGLRAGEACHLETSDVLLDDNLLKIRKKEDWSPKNRTSVRDVPIHPRLKDYLRKRIKTLKVSYICSFEDGRRLDEGVLASMMVKFRKRLAAPGLCFHVLRHTFVSRLAEAGGDTYAISKIVGHSNTKITEDTYTHLKDKYFHKNISLIK